MSKTELNLKALVEAVEKVEIYSADAKSAMEFYFITSKKVLMQTRSGI